MSILDKINSSEDLKKLNIAELEGLAGEIRAFLIKNVSRQGGHLSSNLGAVELTLALHKVFDVSGDRIVWDVGHQAYTHKILTGRKDKFKTLRQKDGISGFPKPSESVADAFGTGHSSTSVSAALGFAKAFELEGSKHRAVAVIGDGAMTGGMAYEALNHAGSGKTPLIIVLNDNGMSISENVGGLSQYFEKKRTTAQYIGFKTRVKKTLKRIPVAGDAFTRVAYSGKRLLKKLLLQKKIFENMGLEYLGTVNGHDLRDLIAVLEYAKNLNKPVIVHVATQKGRGYTPAECDPATFHGVGRFDPDTGELLSQGKATYSDVFGDMMLQLAQKNDKLVCITAAMPTGTGLVDFARAYPDRFFDVGIAEQHAVTFASAMAMSGYTPIFAVYSTFLQRGYDQIFHDAALQKLHVVFAVDRAGAVGSDGETHQGIYDFSYLSHIPNMTIMAPANESEMREMIEMAVNSCTGPVAVRYPKGETDTKSYGGNVEYGRGVAVKEGGDILIAAIGSQVSEATAAAELLEKQGLSVGVMNVRFLKPFDKKLFCRMSKNCRLVVTAEDNVGTGGLGAVASEYCGKKILRLAFSDAPLKMASVKEQKQMASLDAEGMARKILKALKGD